MSPRRLALALVVCALAACGHPSSRAAVDPALARRTLAVVNSARALHHEADAYEDAGDLAHARAAIERVLALEIPADVSDREDLRADAWGRLGELLLDQSDAAGALARVDTALREGNRASVLRARLLMVRGRALRAQAQAAHSAGNSAEETRLRQGAIEALEASIAMNQQVLARLLDGGHAP